MKNASQRILFTLFSTILLAAVGTLGGFLLGRAISLRQAESRLEQYATRILDEAKTSTTEARVVLAEMNASRLPFCSDAEVAYFRNLIFKSQYLKAGGRMQDGKIQCSTMAGSPAEPQAQFKPDFSRLDGSKVYRNLAPFRVSDQTVITVQLGGSYIVYNPYNLKSLAALPMHYTVTAIDAPSQQSGQLLGELPTAHGAVLTTEGRKRVGDSLYATRCSAEYATCMTAYISIVDAMRNSRGYLPAYVVLGGLSGALFGFVVPLLYHRNQSVEQQLLRAIRGDTMSVVYQPIVDLESDRIVEAEALVRWTDEDDRAVSPDVFVKVAEERGFVGAITKLVVRHVVREFGPTMRARPGFRVNVNIAASDLADPEFIPMLEQSLAEAGIQPASLGIEITESYTARQQVAKDTILHLREKGHKVHIDDFGTGYSSLAYLHDLSVDSIKIDKAFTKAIGTDAVTVSILPQILTMAEKLKLKVVVEGIETQAQADYFSAAPQSIHAQGWLFGRPIPARMFLEMLDKRDTNGKHRPTSVGSAPEAWHAV